MKPIRFAFNERKAIQAAARLIWLSGGEMNYLAFFKLTYLIDREALLRFGKPVTGDCVVAMDKGLVLSRVNDLMSRKKHDHPQSEWHKFIPRPLSYVFTVRFSDVLGTSALSDAEVALIDDVFEQFKHKDEYELVDYHHKLGEWQDPKGSSIPIPFENILRAGGKTEAEIEAIAKEAEADSCMDEVLASS